MKVPFGKYKGRDLRDVDAGYLEWLASLTDLREPFRAAVQAEVRRRAGGPDPEAERAYERKSGAVIPRAMRPIATEMITAGYKALALKHHPDAGGTHEAMIAVNRVAELLRDLVEN